MLEDFLKVIALGVGGWALRTLHAVQLDVKSLRVAMVGENGDNGLRSKVAAQTLVLERHDEHLARHDTQIALLRGRE